MESGAVEVKTQKSQSHFVKKLTEDMTYVAHTLLYKPEGEIPRAPPIRLP